MVRDWSAKPLCIGSIPIDACNASFLEAFFYSSGFKNGACFRTSLTTDALSSPFSNPIKNSPSFFVTILSVLTVASSSYASVGSDIISLYGMTFPSAINAFSYTPARIVEILSFEVISTARTAHAQRINFINVLNAPRKTSVMMIGAIATIAKNKGEALRFIGRMIFPTDCNIFFFLIG